LYMRIMVKNYTLGAKNAAYGCQRSKEYWHCKKSAKSYNNLRQVQYSFLTLASNGGGKELLNARNDFFKILLYKISKKIIPSIHLLLFSAAKLPLLDFNPLFALFIIQKPECTRLRAFYFYKNSVAIVSPIGSSAFYYPQ
jgi:hypothetical protein